MHLILSDRSTVRFRFDLNWTVKRQLWSHRDPKELELARRVWDLRYRRGGELTWWEQDAAAVADAEVLLQIRTEVTRVRWRGCNLYLDSRAAATGGGDSAARGRRRRWRLDCWTEAGVVVLDGGRMKETRAELFSRASGDSRGSGALSVEVGRRRPVEKGRIGSSSSGRWASKRQDALARGWRVTWASHPRKRPGSLRDFGFPKGPESTGASGWAIKTMESVVPLIAPIFYFGHGYEIHNHTPTPTPHHKTPPPPLWSCLLCCSLHTFSLLSAFTWALDKKFEAFTCMLLEKFFVICVLLAETFFIRFRSNCGGRSPKYPNY
jgi:hypothetical protein